MPSKLFLNDRQWNKIAKLLPAKQHDRVMIEAILYREFSGQSLTEVAEVFGVTRIRLHTWHNALDADGSLAKVMAVLRLEPAGALARTRSGHRPTYGPEMAAQVAALRLRKFGEALRGR